MFNGQCLWSFEGSNSLSFALYNNMVKPRTATKNIRKNQTNCVHPRRWADGSLSGFGYSTFILYDSLELDLALDTIDEKILLLISTAQCALVDTLKIDENY